MFGAFGALAFVGGVVFLGCSNEAEKCERLGTCSPPSSGSGGGGTSTCVPSKNALPVSDSCGIFVSTSLGDDGGDGSKSNPVRTLAKAIDLAVQGGTSVYACAETFAEAVTVPAGMLFFGGLACSTDWRYAAGEKTTVEAPSDGIGLRLAGGGTGTTRVEDVLVKAADATVPGGSSIAGLIEEGVSAEFARCEFEAGNGRDGAAGEPYSDAAMSGGSGSAGEGACTAAQVFGGTGATNVCGDVTSGGGFGGIGTTNTGGDGSDGFPSGTSNEGTGESVSPCTDGSVGDSGAPGDPGIGGSTLGSLDATGYIGAAGGDGGPGQPAQGGGGGGGAKGGTGAIKCINMTMANGASGGGGGAGGCGGAGGRAGAAGGASIALVSLDAEITFDAVTLKSGDGGRGGDGGPGQSGGDGGIGGPGGAIGAATALNAGCAGGAGGTGGAGGQGGGGRGGHSIGIAFTGSQPPVDGVTITTGTPGMGGASAGGVIQAAVGAKASTQAFP